MGDGYHNECFKHNNTVDRLLSEMIKTMQPHFIFVKIHLADHL